jgi:hypothetical protein
MIATGAAFVTVWLKEALTALQKSDAEKNGGQS